MVPRRAKLPVQLHDFHRGVDFAPTDRQRQGQPMRADKTRQDRMPVTDRPRVRAAGVHQAGLTERSA